ncbi:MAG: hypothetical protein P8P91_04700 [Pseudomonadales bacterium]|nr:hypothetical protein [Pseudomonadales bacterium]
MKHTFGISLDGLDSPSPSGRISIANSDSEAYAYLDAAIDAGWRAVSEQMV